MLEEMTLKLEAACRASEQSEFTADRIIQEVIEDAGPQAALGRKIIKFKAKEMAIEDALMVIRENHQLSVDESLKIIRHLAKTQFRNTWKAKRLTKFCQTGSV